MSIPPLYVVRLAECAGYYKYWSDRTEERCFGAELMSALGHKRTSNASRLGYGHRHARTHNGADVPHPPRRVLFAE